MDPRANEVRAALAAGLGGLAALLCCLVGCKAELRPVVFADVTAAAGVSFAHTDGAHGEYFLIETYGSGCGFLDYDGDGDLDVYLINGLDLKGVARDPVNLVRRSGDRYWVKMMDPPRALPSTDPADYAVDVLSAIDPDMPQSPNRLYRNNGDGTFTDVTRRAGVGDLGYGMGCAVADYDNDGDADLYVTNFGPNALYQNQGDGTFVNVTRRAGVEAPQWSTSTAFFDYDNDGNLDLYVVNYVDFTLETNQICGGFITKSPRGFLAITDATRSYCAPQEYGGVPDLLFRNNGDGSFTDVSISAGVANPSGKGLGIIAWDFDDDGDQDVFVANDGTPNFLYQNSGEGAFLDVSLKRGVAFNAEGIAEACMGVDFGDYDNDGDFDLFFANFSFETHTLFRNEAGFFKDVTVASGLAEVSWLFLAFGTNFLDYDNDGDLDLYVANGHVLDKAHLFQSGVEYREHHHLFRSDGAGRYAEVSAASGDWFSHKQVSRGAAFGDYDDDGDVDVLVANCGGDAKLVRNEGGNQQNWLMVRTVGTRSNRDGVGARVRVVSGDLAQIRQVRSGSSYLAAHDPRLHFGLGTRTEVDLVEVFWPSGTVQHLEDVEANQVLLVTEPQAR